MLQRNEFYYCYPKSTKDIIILHKFISIMMYFLLINLFQLTLHFEFNHL